jgi:hypothetical protein
MFCEFERSNRRISESIATIQRVVVSMPRGEELGGERTNTQPKQERRH